MDFTEKYGPWVVHRSSVTSWWSETQRLEGELKSWTRQLRKEGSYFVGGDRWRSLPKTMFVKRSAVPGVDVMVDEDV